MRDPLPHEALVECAGCGAANERGAGVCLVCGSPLEAGPRAAAGTPVERCRIERWRGYVTSTFYAVSESGALLSESKPIRSRGAAPPADKPKARQAYDQVVAALLAGGWQPDDAAGPEWYARRFTRPLEQVVPQRPVPVVGLGRPAVPAPHRAAVSSPAPQPARAVPPATTAEEPGPRPLVRETPAPEPPPARRRLWLRLLLGVAVTAGAGGSAFLLLAHRHSGAAPTVTPFAAHAVTLSHAHAAVTPADHAAVTPADHGGVTPAPARVHASHARPVVTPPAAVPSRRSVRLRVDAVSGPSWVEIRRESAAGSVLFRATLLKGQHVHFMAPSLWVSIGAASGLVIRVDGKRFPAYGTVTHTFSASAPAAAR